ncbi:MAG TPA: type 1 glutamine amidotransferase [Mycobacteriales bacterium]|nr:type 1 glutamine amidotransferase [Mycobacteriales bacterium]
MGAALVIQHAAVEGVGRFAEWFPAHGIELHVLHPYAGEPLPSAVSDDALIVMGGPMGACDDADVPWLAQAKLLMADAVARRVPTLGVCLGAQLLAVATGGKVEPGGAGPELGLDTVEITVPDQLFDLGELPVVQWHFDTVTALPTDAILLGSSARYAVQAFRVGESAWGVQFHVEATADMVRAWARADRLDEDALAGPVTVAADRLAAAGARLAGRFAELVVERAGAH